MSSEPKEKPKSTSKKKSSSDSSFSLEELSTLLETLKENEVSEFELSRDGEKIKLKRGAQQQQVVVQAAPQQVVAPAVAPIEAQPVVEAAPAADQESKLSLVKPEQAAPKSNLHEIKSPMVGTFYKRPSPDEDAFVEQGDTVKKGATLCIVEAMKLMNEIESDISGRIVEVCLEDGQMAEFGEVLFRIDPAG